MRPTTTYLDAEADARNMSTDALLATIDLFMLDMSDPDLDPAFQYLAKQRHDAFSKEWTHRERLTHLPRAKQDAMRQTHEQWLTLARSVRDAVPVPEVLALIGYPTHLVGKEHHGPCPACRDGTDRLVSWDNPRSRCWCRQCNWRADAIAIVQSFMPGCTHFRDAVRTLAQIANLSEV